MTTPHAEQRRQDLERLLGEFDDRDGKLVMKLQEFDEEIGRSDERVKTGIAGVRQGERTVLHMLERDKAKVVAERESLAVDRAPVEAEYAELESFIEHTKGKVKS